MPNEKLVTKIALNIVWKRSSLMAVRLYANALSIEKLSK